MEIGGVAVGAEEGRCEFSDGSRELKVGFAQEGEIKREQGEKEGESGLLVCVPMEEGNKEDIGDGNGKSAVESVLQEGKKKVAGKIKKGRGRPRKNREEGENTKVMEEKPQGEKRGSPRKNIKEQKKKRGRPRKVRKEEENLEVIENNGVGDVNKELAGEEEAKGLNLKCMKVEEAVYENGEVNIEEKELREENYGRNDDHGQKGKSDSGRRILVSRKSSIEAKVRIVQSRIEDEVLEEELRVRKRRCHQGRYEKEAECEAYGGESEVNGSEGHGENQNRQGGEPSKGLEKQEEEGYGKEAEFKENGGESEVNKGEKDGGTKKKRGRKKSKGVEKQKENGRGAGEFVDEKDKEQDGVNKNKMGQTQSRDKKVEREGEGKMEDGQSLSSYSFRARKEKTEEAPKRKILEDENGNSLSNMCHQCQRNDKGMVVRCTKCRTKRYCFPCMNRWYAQ